MSGVSTLPLNVGGSAPRSLNPCMLGSVHPPPSHESGWPRAKTRVQGRTTKKQLIRALPRTTVGRPTAALLRRARQTAPFPLPTATGRAAVLVVAAGVVPRHALGGARILSSTVTLPTGLHAGHVGLA
jgi:hypothetical protein